VCSSDLAAKAKGYAKHATRLLVEFGFGQLGLNEIHLEVKEDNTPAIAIYMATGFAITTTQDGLLSMSMSKKG
jgi:RimJ/RimL family protein N-acetyltransferase